MADIRQKLQNTLDKAIDNKKVFGTSFSIRYKDIEWSGASGNLTVESPYFTASVTKLFVAALIMRLRQQNKLSLDDKIAKYFSPDVMNGLHVYQGRDYSGEITLRNLLAHTSGIPCYFQGKDKTGHSLEQGLLQGKDRSWSFEQAIELSKRVKPRFAPNTKGKALYSDTNFQLLGKVLEQVYGTDLSTCMQEQIIQPLGLANTYLYLDATDTTPQTMYYKDKELPISQAMASFGPDGSIVSTSGDLLKFVEAFFAGAFFPVAYFEEMKVWNPIFYPLRAGIGIHLFRLPLMFEPIGKMPELYGHSGISGAMAYSNPEKGLYITGTVNQIANPSTSFRLALKLIGISLRG
jgi:D-alanyl-D-alanine carboxypeptidase